MRTANGAVAWMADQSRRGTTGWRGFCLRASRMSWGLPGGWADANAWWAAVPPQHRHAWSSRPPLGAPVYFAGGNHGHIGISDGQGGLWHTDAPNVDRIGLTSINWPRDRWGFRNVGWASWLNGAVLPVGGSPTTPPPNDGGDDMPLTQSEIDRIAAAVWSRQFTEYVDENGNGRRDARTTADILFATHANAVRMPESELVRIAAQVWLRAFAEYVDENGNGRRDSRTVADILFATHGAAVRTEQGLARPTIAPTLDPADDA